MRRDDLRELARQLTFARPLAGKESDWRTQLKRLSLSLPQRVQPTYEEWRPGRELLYVIDIAASRTGGSLLLEIFYRDLKQNGDRGKPKSRYIPREWLRHVPDTDRQILAYLGGADVVYDRFSTGGYGYGGSGMAGSSLAFRYRVPDPLLELMLPALCRTQRCRLRLSPSHEEAAWLSVSFVDEEPWEFRLAVVRVAERYEVAGQLVRGAERMDLAMPLLMLNAGFLLLRDRVGRFEARGAFEWVYLLRGHGRITVPVSQAEEFVSKLLLQPRPQAPRSRQRI